MKILSKIFIVLLLLVVLIPTYLFFSFRSSKPKDLGINYTPADLSSGRGKAKLFTRPSLLIVLPQ